METLQRTANRGSVPTGYEIDNSLKLEADNSERLKSNSYHASSTPTSSKIGTFSFWVKRTELGANYMVVSGNSARYSRMYFNSDDKIQLYSGDSSWNSVQPITSTVYRDTAAWYHIVLRLDSTDSTASNRLRLYVNGEEQAWGTSPNITQDGVFTLCEFGGPTWHSWGSNLSYFTPSAYFSGYLAEVHYVDGQALAPTEFGETDSDSGIWKPKEYGGTYGNSGYYMDFEDASNLGDDESGNGFDFDENNITSIDQSVDTPTNNFAIPNVLWNNYNTATRRYTAVEGGTRLAGNQSNVLWRGIPATIPVSSGKWYVEVEQDSTNSTNFLFGYGSADEQAWDWRELTAIPSGANNGGGAKCLYSYNHGVYGYDSAVDPWQYGGGNSRTQGDVLCLALDLDNGYGYWRKDDGAWFQSGDPSSGSSGTGGITVPWNSTQSTVIVHHTARDSGVFNTNYGGFTKMTISSPNTDANGYGRFKYAVPSGYYALCTKNVAEYG